MEPTTLDILQEAFYTAADMNDVIEVVANNFFIIIAVLLGTYPFLMILKKLVKFCEAAFDSEGIRKMEGGSIWNKLPDGSLYTNLERIASTRVFEKHLRKR